MDEPLPLLEALDEVGAAVESADHLALFLDFDGTLAPIVESPGLARMAPMPRAALEQLASRPDCTVGIISGRALDDVRMRVGIDGLVYAGNHGLEIAGRGLQFDEAMAARLRCETAEVVEMLAGRLAHFPGVLVEAKGPTASVHYRRVHPRDRDEVERAVRRAVPDDHPHLAVVRGKMVWEVRPRVGWNKGSALRWVRERLGLTRALTFYLGDDLTDEDAFAAVGRFVTARVGPSQTTLAGYRISDTHEVAEFLVWLCRVLRFADPLRTVRGGGHEHGQVPGRTVRTPLS
jgi:trehalose-phosphatase